MIYRLKELKGDTIAVPQLVFSKLGIAEEYNVRVALYVLATGVTDPDKLCADLKLRSRISDRRRQPHRPSDLQPDRLRTDQLCPSADPYRDGKTGEPVCAGRLCA